MTFFRTITSLIKPRKVEFIKTLIAKRQSLSNKGILANLANHGTMQYNLRILHLECMEYAFTPESTIVNILEQYQKSNIHHFYRNFPYSYNHKFATEEQRDEDTKRATRWLIGSIEYQLTLKPDATAHIPEFDSLVDYILYKVKIEHPNNPDINPDNGFNDEFFAYAIKQSEYVFCR